MKHECDPNWKQLGSVASGVLRSVAEKRMKQAEFLEAEKGRYEAPLQSREQDRLQLVLPLSSDAASLAFTGVGRV